MSLTPPAASQPATLFEVHGAVATLTLNDTRRMNPLTATLLGECLQALAKVRADASIRVLVVKANGKGFCSGADLVDIDPAHIKPDDKESVGDRVHALLKDFAHPWIEGIRALDVPVVSAVHGVAAGGGVGFALASDIVVMSRTSYFYLPFVPALGLVPDMNAGWLLPRAIGTPRALAMMLLGDKLGAEDAASSGLVYKCVDDDKFAEEVDKLAARLAALPPHAMKEMRAMLRQSREAQVPQFLEYERDRQRELIDGQCFAEGVAAFKERRTPKFNG